MKNLLFINLIVSIIFSQDIWLNEIHYDNAGTDEGEFIELAVSSNFSNLSGVTITLYNGNSGNSYNSISLNDFISGDTNDGITFYYYDFPSNGIQNGSPDGICIDNNNEVIQFLSYEGTMNANDGPAAGETSEDIGISEVGSPIGESLQLQGVGETYSSFIWFGPIASTKGSINTNQIIGDSGTIYGCTDSSAINFNEAATDDDGSCEYAIIETIYNIQYTTEIGEGTYDCFPSPYGVFENEQYVTTTGVVTAVQPTDNPNFFIQDFSTNSYAGINIFDNTWSPVVGDEITITGKVLEYYGLTEITALTEYNVNSTGNSLSIKDVNTGELSNGCTEEGEALEGMLVRVSDISVTQSNNEFNEWFVDDGTGACKIDDYYFDGIDWPNPSQGEEYVSITGVVNYAYGDYRILPRNFSDLELCPTCPIADAGLDQTVSPGTEVTLDGTNSYDPDGSIIAYEWNQISGTSVSLTAEEESITSFIAPDFSDLLIFRLTVYDNEFSEAIDEVAINIAGIVSIEDIQCPEGLEQGDYCYETSLSGSTVLTSGIVTHVTPGDYPNFFLQQTNNNCSGIYVYDTSIIPALGDELILSGTVNEYYSFTQLIDITSFETISTSNSMNPTNINTGDLGIVCSEYSETLESMLVEITNVTVENIDEFGNVQLNDGSGPTLMDDYYFDGNWESPSIGDTYTSIVGVVGYSYSEFKIYPRNNNDFNGTPSCPDLGDVNNDGGFNVLDVVALANCVLEGTCEDIENNCAADMNGDGGYNVLDIVALANCILQGTCED